MSFTHLAHDACAYKHRLLESVGASEYVMDTTASRHCRPCFVPSAGVRLQKYGGATCASRGDLVDVSSELLGITRQQSKCPSKQCVKRGANLCDLKKDAPEGSRECNGLDPENCRLSNPPCTLRGRGWNRWENPCRNPQLKIERPFAFNVNNRLLVKDMHRPCVVRPPLHDDQPHHQRAPPTQFHAHHQH